MTYVIERPVMGDVQAPTWAGYAKGTDHAFLVPVDVKITDHATDGKIASACGMTLDAGRLAKGTRRCKRCVAQFTQERKPGKALTEHQIEPVATGLVDGDPRAAESRRAAEVKAISGDAIKDNAAIVENLRAGNRESAFDAARKIDRRGPASPVPTGPSLGTAKGKSTNGAAIGTAGQRGEARTDGVAMVQGANMAPVQPRSGWIAKAGTLAMPLGRERADSSALGKPVTAHNPKLHRECAERRCAHIVGDIPANRVEAITYREYSELTRSRQVRHWKLVRRVKASIERERAFAARQPVKIHSGRKSEGDSPEIEELMAAPGRRDGLSWAERKATTVR